MKTLRRKFVFWVGLALLIQSTGFAQSITPPELGVLRQKYDAQIGLATRGASALDQNYLAALNRLLAAETEVGNIEIVLAVKQEIEVHGDGSGYSPASFQTRLSSHAALKKLQTTYQEARKKVDVSSKEKVSEVTVAYDRKLAELVTMLTKSGRIDDALVVKTERGRISGLVAAAAKAATEEAEEETDTSSSQDDEPIRARAYCSAKAQAEIFLNGKQIRLRSDNQGGGTNGKSSYFNIQEGDTVVVRAKSNFVFRSVALAFELSRQKRVIFFKPTDYRILGKGDGIDPEMFDAKAILAKPEKHPQGTVPDDYWTNKWEAHDLGGGGFVKPEPAGDWAVWGAILTKEMIERKN